MSDPITSQLQARCLSYMQQHGVPKGEEEENRAKAELLGETEKTLLADASFRSEEEEPLADRMNSAWNGAKEILHSTAARKILLAQRALNKYYTSSHSSMRENFAQKMTSLLKAEGFTRSEIDKFFSLPQEEIRQGEVTPEVWMEGISSLDQTPIDELVIRLRDLGLSENQIWHGIYDLSTPQQREEIDAERYSSNSSPELDCMRALGLKRCIEALERLEQKMIVSNKLEAIAEELKSTYKFSQDEVNELENSVPRENTSWHTGLEERLAKFEKTKALLETISAATKELEKAGLTQEQILKRLPEFTPTTTLSMWERMRLTPIQILTKTVDLEKLSRELLTLQIETITQELKGLKVSDSIINAVHSLDITQAELYQRLREIKLDAQIEKTVAELEKKRRPEEEIRQAILSLEIEELRGRGLPEAEVEKLVKAKQQIAEKRIDL